MISYRLPDEREMILRYAELFQDGLTQAIIARDSLRNSEEALHLARFFWKMVDASTAEDAKSEGDSEYILEKIIITFMAYFSSAGYEDEWEQVSDES